MQSSSGNTNNTNTKAGVHEGVVEVAALIRSHATILSRLAVEDHVRGQDGTTDDGSTVKETLGHIPARSLVGRLHVRPLESILEGLSGLGEDRRGTGLEALGLRWFEGRIVDESSGIGGLGHLAQCRSHSEGASEEERHDYSCQKRVEDEVEEEQEVTGDISLHYGGRNVLEAQSRGIGNRSDIQLVHLLFILEHFVLALAGLLEQSRSASVMSMETINLPHLPAALPVHVALYRDVQNASFLRQQLLSANADFEYAFIDATMVCLPGSWCRARF